ncbi:phage tail protein [Acinetobacter pittii]|uniref:TipJ family phage tail tip protein n=1 Tax=Acinetobacter pittii TaxID=48296 RepID=UPI001D183503|nr:phage tail protein [Acinetobacter pittii]
MSIVKGSKKGSGQARQPNIAPDSAQSKTRINILYGLAEGEIEGLASGNKSILLENTPLEDNNGKLNFESVKVDFRSGTNDQDYIEGFPAVESETAIDVELKAGTPWVKSFKNLDLDALRIRLKWGPLRTQDATSGDVSGVTIEYAVDLQTDGGPWTEVLKTKISDKTSANYERAHRINLPKADSDWLIRVRRITPNSTSEYVSDKMYIEAVTEVIDAKLRYPNTALLGLQYDAETFNNVAKIAVECKGTKIKLPSNYNPVSRTYAGMWDGTFISAYSNNPAWVYYDICTSDRYGLGDRLTPFMIDKWSLYRLGQYCDEFVADGQGGQEPRFTCNVYLQRAEEAYEILKKLAGIFRAISYWDGNSIICDADIPQDTYFTYTRANVIGEFEYSGTRARDRHNVVKVAFDNPANHYKTEYEYVRDEQAISDSGQVRILDLNAWGCTSRGQAQRAGLWALKSEQSETRTVTFKVGLDGWIPQPGRVIEIADELFAGRANGGRVSAISEDRVNLTIDRDDVVAKPGDRLVVNGENGKAQTRVIQSINGRVITVTLPFDLGSIAAENIWVIDAQDLATMKFRVISIRQEEKNKFTINAIQYNSKKFDEIDSGAYFEEVPISVINPTIQDPVSDILITSENKVNQGINITTMILSWKQAKGAVKYLVEWRKDNGSWLRLPLTGNNSLEVQGVYSGNYQARVTAISAFEVSSLPVYSSITEVVGKKGLPPKLEFIRATGILFGMQLDWSFPNVGAQDAAYVEIRVSPDGVSNIAPLGQFAYPTNTHKVQGLQPNLIQYYSGRIVDKIGNVGAWSEWVNGTTIADPEAVLDLISGHITESDLTKELQGKIENTVNVAEAAEQAATNAQTAASSAQTAASNAQMVATDTKTAATSAQTAASTAQTQATNAQQVANEAGATAANAKNAADQAASTALTANSIATNAKTAADNAQTLAQSATSAATAANTAATNAQTTATNAQTAANDAVTAASKVASDLTTSTNQLNQKIADETSARTTAISQMKDGLTTETTQRKSEDVALLSNIETYKSSTNNSLASLQTQITTNATNTSANTSKISSLDSRLTTNEGKTADAINSAATAQQTANTAVTNAAATASAVTSLKSELSTGKGINNIVAPYSDPQELSVNILGASRTVALVNSLMRLKGKAYDVTFTAAAGNIYFGSASTSTVNTTAAGSITGGKRYMLSAYFKNLDAAKQADVYISLLWFRRAADDTVSTAQATLQNQATGNLRVTPTNDGGTISFKAVTAPADAFAFSFICTGNGTYNVVGSRILIDMLMLEEYIGDDKPASTWTAGPADLGAIKSALDANASAISTLTTRVTNDEGVITSQGNSITQLNNSITTINGTLTNKADATALNALTNRVSNAEGVITSQGNSITQLNNSVNSINGTLSDKADATALNSLTNRVTTAEGQITAQGSAIVSIKNDLVATNNALSTKADSSALNTLDSKVTSIDGRVTSNAGAITSLKSELSAGKGSNLLIAPFSDPQVVPYTATKSGVEVSIADSTLRTGKAYNFKNLTANISNYVYIGNYSDGRQAPVAVRGGSKLLFSFYAKADVAGFIGRFALRVFNQSGANVQVVTLLWTSTQTQNVLFTNDLVKYTLYLSSPIHADGVTASILLYTGGASSAAMTPAGAILTMDKLMIEEYVGDNKDGSPWVAGSADLNGIYASLDASATAVSNLTTRVTNAEGTLTSQGNSITSLRNDLTTTNSNVSKKADTSALTSLDTKVTSIDGRVTTNTNAVTALQGRVTTVESGLSTKADASALSNYYTKTEADSATSGAIDTFNSQLTIGGVNAVANSEAPRTPTAATNKEYLLYERSAELKAFYDENLDTPITISFEMSVPVVGAVQVYASNNSAHTFSISVNAVIANQWIKYSVTVNPRTHTASTTVSTIEFYGTYGTGRIPTIRKLQIEAGTKATAWSPSPRDTKALIDTNATAIQTTQTQVNNIDGRLTTATESITSLGSRMTTAEGNITGTNNAVSGFSTRMTTAEGKITNQSDSIASLQNSVTSINGTLADKADSSAVTNLTSRVTAAEGNITSQSGQITTLNNSLTTTNNTLNDVNALARLLSLGKPLRDDPTFKTTSSGGLSAYVFPTGTSWVKQAKSADNPTDSTSEMLIRATQVLGGGWYPTIPTLVLTANKTFLIKQIIKMPVGTKLLAVGNTTGTGGYIRILGNDLGTGKFETYYTVIQGGPDVANTIQGHNRVINGTNPPVPSTANPVDVILASYEVFDVTAVNDTIPKAYSDSIAANASAISNLTNTVTQQGNTITSHSNSITSLNNSITSINGSLANKAESSALQSLDSKVTTIDGKVTSNTSALTALQSSFDGLPNQGVNLLGPEISNPVEKPTNWVSGLPYEVVSSTDTVNVRAFQFTMPAASGSGLYFNIGGGQVPRQWLTEGKYIFSFVAKTVDGTPPHPIDWLMYNVSATRLRFNITATLTRYSGVFTVPAGGAAACMLLIGNPTAKAVGQVVVIERMMLERQVGSNTTPSTWIAGSDPSGMIISTQAKATDLFNTATNQNSATAGRVTSLESRMTSTEGALSTKADASALQTLDTKVTTIDGKVNSNASAITSLSSTLSNSTSSISMNAGNSFTDWILFNAVGEYSIIAQTDGQAGKVIQLGNNAGNDMVWMHPNNFIPFDATKTYRLRARYRRRSGTGVIYVGVSQKTPDKASYVTNGNTLSGDMGSSNYVINGQNPTQDQWQEVVAYFKGRSTGAVTGSGSLTSPRTISQQAGFITPMFLANYTNQTGIVELDYLILEDAEAIADNQANATALTTLDTKVTEVDGRLATATNSITVLGSRMSTAEGNISATNSALSGLSTRMTAAEGGLTNQSNSITSLTNSINSLDSDSLIPDYNLANSEKWISHYGYAMAKYFKTTTTGKVSNTVFRKDTTVPVNCFNYARTPLPNDRTYKVSFWVRCSADSNGLLMIPIGRSGNDGKFTTSGYTSVGVAVTDVPKNETWTKIEKIVNLTSTSDANPQLFFGIAPGHTGTSGWWEVQGYKVSPVLTTADADSSFATSAALSSLTSTVNQQGSTITSQGTDITNLKNSVTSINGTLTNKADATAVNTLSNRVTAAEGNITSQGNSITSLNNTLANNDLSNLILNPDFVDPKSGWTAGVIVDATDAAPNPPSPKALKLNNRDSYYGPHVKCNVGDMFYVSAWFATPNTSATATAVIGLNTRNVSAVNGWYTVAAKSTDKTTWTMVEGYFTVPAGAVEIRPWLQVSIAAADAAAQLWHVTNIQVRNITGNKKLASDLQATSSALSTLDSKVTNIDGRVTSASNNIVTLNNSVTDINTALSQKADASALSSLSNRVTTAEGNISSQGSSITSLTNNLAVTTNTANAALPKIQGGAGAAKLFRGVLVFQQNGANVVGNIVIQTPITFTSKMFRLALTGYNYLAGKTDINLNIGGYAYTGTSIIQHGVVNSGTLPMRVRMGVRNGTVVVILTSQAPNAYWQYPKFNIDAEIGYTTPPDDWINGWSASLIAEADLASSGISAIVEPSLLDVSTQITANASAISNLTNTVTQQGDTLTSHSNSITTLNNSITSINGALNTKANTSAVTDLDSRVTTAEGKITANTSSITSLTANLKNVANGITMSASLDVDPDSEWIYWTKNGEVARADDTSALGGKVYRFGNNAGNDHVNARSKAKLPFDQTKTYRIRARYRRLSGTGTVYCAICCLALDGTSHVNSNNTVSTDFGSSNYFVINQSPANNVWQEVTVYVKGRSTGAATGSWTLAAPRQMPNATAFLSVQFLANYSNAAGMTELDYIIIEDADAIAANDATANALSSLDTRVTTAEGKITSQGSSITSLNNSITTINGTLSSKADSSALTNLANRVTVTEGSITSQGSSITSLNSSVNGLLKDIEVTDTRSTNQPPSWYWTNYPKRIVREFKQASALGLSGMGTYVSLETYVYWTDASGGPIIQIARGTDSKLTAERRSTSATTWYQWSQDIKTLSDGLENKAEASALTSLDAKVTTIDGKVSTQATSITNLTTTVGGHTSSIQSQQESIDGLKTRATLKLQSGNLVGGVGIENDSKTVDFIIQANRFAIGAPSTVTGAVTPKYAFTYQSTSTTLPNGTVIPAGLYLDNASIGYINADKINAVSLSTITGTIGLLRTATTGKRSELSDNGFRFFNENGIAVIELGDF